MEFKPKFTAQFMIQAMIQFFLHFSGVTLYICTKAVMVGEDTGKDRMNYSCDDAVSCCQAI